MPTCEPKFQPKAESVGVVDLFAPGTASPTVTLTGVTLPVSTVSVCNVSNLGALPKPCAVISVKLWAIVATGNGGVCAPRVKRAIAVPPPEHQKHAPQR